MIQNGELRTKIDELRCEAGHELASHSFPSVWLWKEEMGLQLCMGKEYFAVRAAEGELSPLLGQKGDLPLSLFRKPQIQQPKTDLFPFPEGLPPIHARKLNGKFLGVPPHRNQNRQPGGFLLHQPASQQPYHPYGSGRRR